MSKKMYIAGPMTGIEGYNFDAFNRAERKLKNQFHNIKPINPAGKNDLDKDGNPTKTKEEFIKRDIRKLSRCDAICLLNGWKLSSGTQTELRAAKEMGLEFYQYIENGGEVRLECIEEPETVLREAENKITGKKMLVYGSPETSFKKIAKMWSGLFDDNLEKDLEAKDVAQAMICLKQVREKNEHKRDNLVDIAGYAGTIELMKYLKNGKE